MNSTTMRNLSLDMVRIKDKSISTSGIIICHCFGYKYVIVHKKKILQKCIFHFMNGCRGRDCMVVGFTTTYVIGSYHH